MAQPPLVSAAGSISRADLQATTGGHLSASARDYVACLQLADLRWITAAAGLEVADNHMAILAPPSPPIDLASSSVFLPLDRFPGAVSHA
jgi:hypothetical protein